MGENDDAGEDGRRNHCRPDCLDEQPRRDRRAGIGAFDHVSDLVLRRDAERKHREQDGEPDDEIDRQRERNRKWHGRPHLIG